MMRRLMILLNRLLVRSQNLRIRVNAGIRLAHLGDKAGVGILVSEVGCHTWDYNPTDQILSELDQFGDDSVALQLLERSFLFEDHLQKVVTIANNHGIPDSKIVGLLAQHLQGHQTPRVVAAIGRLLASLHARNPGAFQGGDPIPLFVSCLVATDQPELVKVLIRLGGKQKAVERYEQLFQRSELWGGAQERAKIVSSVKALDEHTGVKLETRDRLERAHSYLRSLQSDLAGVDSITVVDDESYDHPIFGPSMKTIPNPNREADCQRIEHKIRETAGEIAALEKKLQEMSQ